MLSETDARKERGRRRQKHAGPQADCRFETSYVPIEILEDLGKRFPALDFSLCGHDLLADIAYRGSIKDGKLALREAPLIFETAEGVVVPAPEGMGERGSYRIGE